MRWPSALVILVALGARAGAGGEVREDRVARLAAAERTIELVAARDREHRARLAARVRALAKLAQPGRARLWVEPAARMEWLARRAAMGRVLRRDLRELAILRAERQAAVAARDRVQSEIGAAEPAGPAPRSLVRPIRGARIQGGFGPRRHPASGRDVAARGVELPARAGDPVLAVATGVVRWTGPLAGGARAVLVDHTDFVSVVVGLGVVGVTPGQPVAAGEVLGEAAGGALHLEIRLRTGPFGHPVDPAPLLAR
ncbi:MAG TPA: peptidoglycan DD-metalloendopeptidase family protein [Kofleriaceae bacterium]|nr:peptidoglycan DD-metalloendopeptidase family protein [Kofleriaceae bacterium]